MTSTRYEKLFTKMSIVHIITIVLREEIYQKIMKYQDLFKKIAREHFFRVIDANNKNLIIAKALPQLGYRTEIRKMQEVAIEIHIDEDTPSLWSTARDNALVDVELLIKAFMRKDPPDDDPPEDDPPSNNQDKWGPYEVI